MTRSVHCEFNCITVGRVRLRIHRFLFTNQATTAGQRWSCYTVNILSIPFLTQPLNNIIFSKEICYRQPNRKKERKNNGKKIYISEAYRVREGRSERDNRFLRQLFFFLVYGILKPPALHATRYLVGHGHQKGGVVAKVYNNDPKQPLNIIYLDVIPW